MIEPARECAPGRQRLQALAAQAGSLLSGWEQSCKLGPDKVDVGRAGFGLGTSGLKTADCRRMLQQLACPEALQHRLLADSAGANHFYLAVEGDRPADPGLSPADSGPGFKAYLEFPVRVWSQGRAGRRWGEPACQLIGYKWNARGEWRLTRYTLHPGLSLRTLRLQLPAAHPMAGVIAAVIRLCPDALDDPQRIDILSVAGDGGSPLAWDIRLYDLGLQVAALRPALIDCVDARVRSAADAALRDCADADLGHVTAGLDGAAQPVLTVYWAPRPTV